MNERPRRGRAPARESSSQRPPFERIALILQGGGALGAYQAGVYQALDEAGIEPDWVAGISIGAINAALIAGNEPSMRVQRLREFWEIVSESPFGIPRIPGELHGDLFNTMVNQFRSFGILLGGAPGFFEPRLVPPSFQSRGSEGATSFYDVAPLRTTLERLVDFDRINQTDMHFAVGAVNVRTGNFAYFDNAQCPIHVDHVIASGSLPPGFPATVIDGEHYWDGGLVSNTPLQYVLDSAPRKDTLAFQVDLWNARGEVPRDLVESDVRQKDIRFSSRTRAGTDQFKKMQCLRRAAARLLAQMPPELRQSADAELLAAEADEKNYNIVQLIYHAKSYEGMSKDYNFSRRTMEEHWQSGYSDALHTLQHPEILKPSDTPDGVLTFDLAHQRR